MLCTSVYRFRRFGGIIASIFGDKFTISGRRLGGQSCVDARNSPHCLHLSWRVQ